MPMADNMDDIYGKPTRSFLYGPDKTKKSWWALRAAEAGFNVVMIDGDDGSSIVKQLPVEAQKRILIVDAVNTNKVAVFARLMVSLMRDDNVFLWDETAKNSVSVGTKRHPDHSYVYFDLNQMTMNDVLIIDSWTRLADSLMIEWARDGQVDLMSIEREGDQLAMMNYQSRFLNYILNKIQTLQCHVICIGHETVYEKFEDKEINGRKKRVMIEQRTQPFSSTGPHAKKIGAFFSNILRFKKLSDIAFQIDAGGEANTMGGARLLEPKKYNWNEISPNTLFAKVGSKPTGEPCKGAIWIAPGGEFNLGSVVSQTVVPKPQGATVSAQPPVVSAGEATTKISLLSKLQKKPT